MAGSSSTNPSYARSIDLLFAQLPGDGSRQAPPDVEVMSAPEEPQPPPPLTDSSSIQAAYEWLQSERKRLEEYTRSQFEIIRQQHQALMAKHFRSEEALALRGQELNREMQFLSSQAETLQKRGRELAEWEMALTAQVEKLSEAQEALLAVQQTSENIRQDTEAQYALLEELRTQTAALQKSEGNARAEFEDFETKLRDHHQAWEKKQAAITARQEEMEARYLALEKAEEAARRRWAELDELEEQLRREVETQERQLAMERRDMEMLRAKLRMQSPKRESGRNGSIADSLAAIRAGKQG